MITTIWKTAAYEIRTKCSFSIDITFYVYAASILLAGTSLVTMKVNFDMNDIIFVEQNNLVFFLEAVTYKRTAQMAKEAEKVSPVL